MYYHWIQNHPWLANCYEQVPVSCCKIYILVIGNGAPLLLHFFLNVFIAGTYMQKRILVEGS